MKLYRVQFYNDSAKKVAYVVAYSEQDAISEVQKVYNHAVVSDSTIWLYNMVVL